MAFKKSKRFFLALLPAASFLVANTAAGATSPKAPEGRSPLRIAVREFIPPYVEDGAQSGIEIDIIRTVLSNTDYPFEFIQQPRVRMIAAFEDERVDGIITQNVNASSQGCATDWYISHQNVAKTLSSRKLTINHLSDLSKYSVLSFSGATRYIGDRFAAAVGKAKRYTESGDQGTHIPLLYKRRFDVVVGDRWILKLAQKAYFEETAEYEELDTHIILEPTLYVARFQDQAVCDAFNSSLLQIRASGEYAEIWAGYQAKMIVDADSNQPNRH